MQKLCEVTVETYLAAGNPFDVVPRPQECESCGERGCFHRHTTYERYFGAERREVARFLCVLCGLTVSVLPAFVLPYRSRLVEAVDRYFMAEHADRVEMSDADLLRRYWLLWVAHMASVQCDTGWPPVRLAREPRAYWRQMREAAGSMVKAQCYLLEHYGVSLLRRYACHRAPRRFDC